MTKIDVAKSVQRVWTTPKWRAIAATFVLLALVTQHDRILADPKVADSRAEAEEALAELGQFDPEVAHWVAELEDTREIRALEVAAMSAGEGPSKSSYRLGLAWQRWRWATPLAAKKPLAPSWMRTASHTK